MAVATRPRWQYDWSVKVGERPLEQNQDAFFSMLETTVALLQECGGVELVYSDVVKVCQPQYLFAVLRDMKIGKLMMQVLTVDGLRVIWIRVLD